MTKTAEWKITDKNGNTYTIDGVSVEDGHPSFTIGQTVTLELLFTNGTHISDYDSIVEFGEYLYDGVVEYDVDLNEKPFYKEFGNPDAPDNISYLWKIEPQSIEVIDGHWIVVTSIDDNTRIRGAGERVTIEGFVLAPTSEGDRSYIVNNYEV